MMASDASSNRLRNAVEHAKVISAIAPNVPVGIWFILRTWPMSTRSMHTNIYIRVKFINVRVICPPYVMHIVISCNVENTVMLFRFTHILVQAEEKKSSPVKDAWIYPYLENC